MRNFIAAGANAWRHLQGIGVLMAGRFSEALLQLVHIRLYSEMLPVAEVGRLALVQSIINFFTSLFLVTSGSFMLRQFLEWRIEGRQSAQLKAFGSYLLLLPVIAAILLAGAWHWMSFAHSFSWLAVFLLVSSYLVLFGGEQALVGFINIIGRRGWYVTLANLGVALGMGLSLLFATRISPSAEAWQAGTILGYALLLPVCIWLLSVRQSRDEIARPVIPAAAFYSRAALHYTLPLAAATLCFWAQTAGYRLGVANGSSTVTLGIFAVGITLGTLPISLTAKVINDYLAPAFYSGIAHKDDPGKIDAWRQLAVPSLAILIFLAPITAAAGAFLARILVGVEYWQYYWLAYFGAAFQFFMSAYGVYGLLAQALRRNDLVLAPNILAGAIIMGGAFLLGGWHPLLSTGVILVLGGIALVAGTHISLRRRHVFTLPWRALLRPAAAGLAGWAGLVGALALVPHPSLWASLGFLALAGAYVVLAGWWLARPYLSVHFKTAS